MFKILRKLYHKRKAVSPVVATLLLIALVVAASAIVYVIYIYLIRKSQISAAVLSVKDSNKDSQYDEVTLQIANIGTLVVEITNITIWTVPVSLIGDSNNWHAHVGWTFENENDATHNPSEINEVIISTEDQIVLTFWEYTYYRLEITYSGNRNPFLTDWSLLNDFADLSDLLLTFQDFNLTAEAFDGTIDDPRREDNNYNTTGHPIYGPLKRWDYNYLPVLDESELIPFYVTDGVVVFHADRGNLTEQPLVQNLVLPFVVRASKLFLLGLAGSWGDEFPTNAWALKITIVYTDDSTDEYELGHDYIDDWWYDSNRDTSPTGASECVSAPYGKITEIDLGIQVDTPEEPLHTHTTRFYFDFYKYIKNIIFEDPGNDHSAPHLLGISFR
jgi:flagellin-like protein